MKPIGINTCVFGAKKLSKAAEYSAMYGQDISFEILSMFDLADFEEKLKENLDVFRTHRISFHDPVFGAEHSARRGCTEYEETMRHIRKTIKYAKELHASHLTMHLNNCAVVPEKKEEMLKNALENYQELTELFGAFDCTVRVENTGTIVQRNMLLDQREFTDICRRERFAVLIDIGHANANGWDIEKLIDDLAPQVCAYHLHNNDGVHDEHRRLHDGTMDFDRVIAHIREKTPSADLIIEYVKPEQEGEGLHEDIREMLRN